MGKNFTRVRARFGMFMSGTESRQHLFRSLFLSLLLISSRPLLTHADSGIFQSYIILNRGWGNEYYAGGNNADGASAFDGANFGSFWPGQSFTLNGGEVKNYKNNGSDVYGANLHYRIYDVSNTPGDFVSVSLPFNCEYPDCLNNYGDQKWTTTDAGIDLLNGLIPGNYYLEVYWDSPSSDGTNYDSNYGNNFKASFTVACVSPWLSASTTDPTCQGAKNGAIDLTHMNGTPPYTYEWSNGDTTEDIGGLSYGSYYVTVTTPGGCSTTNYYWVNDGPWLSPPDIGGGFSSITCPGQSVSLDAGSGYASYLWSDGSTDQSLTATHGGSYSVVVTTAEGCVTTAWTWINENYQVPTQINSTTDEACVGESIGLNAWPQNDISSWLWNFGDGATSTNNNIDHSYSAEGTYDVQLTMNSNSCGTITLHKTETVSNTAIPTAMFWTSSNSVCPGDAIWMNPQNYRGQNYYWDFGDGTSSGSQGSIQHSFSSAGDYSVTLYLTNSCGQVGSYTQTVSVQENLYFPSWINIYYNPWPEACINQPISFGVSYPASSYQWDFGDGSYGTGENPNHAYAGLGDYTPSVHITNGCGHDTTISTTIHIGDNLSYTGDAYIYVGPGTTACPGDKLYFNAPNANSYLWDFGDGTTSTDQYPNHSFSDYGVHNVALTLTNYCGNSKTITTDILVNNSVVPDIDQNSYGAPTGGGCPGDSIIFYSLGGSHYLWDFGDGTSTTVTHPIEVGNGQVADITAHAYPAVGTYTVHLTYYNGCENSVTKSFDVTVGSDEPLIGGMAPMVNPYLTCHEATFAAFGGNAKTWDFGDGTVISSSSVEMTHTYKTAGDYNLTLTIANGCGASATFNAQITVVTSPDAQTFYTDADGDGYGSDVAVQTCSQPDGTSTVNGDCDDVNRNVHPGVTDICNGIDDNCNGATDENPLVATVTPAGIVNTCQGTGVTLTASLSGLLYQWRKNGVAISGATNQTYNATKKGNYQVSESNTSGCSATSLATKLNILAKPSIQIVALGNLDICNTGSVSMQANSSSAISYQWKKGSKIITGATNTTYTATTASTYKCIATSSDGCTKTSNGLKVVKSCKEDLNSSMEKPTLAIYPNPSDGNFRVNMTLENDEADVQLIIYNALGQICYSENLHVSNGDISAEIHLGQNNPAGIYLLKVIDGTSLFTKQILLE